MALDSDPRTDMTFDHFLLEYKRPQFVSMFVRDTCKEYLGKTMNDLHSDISRKTDQLSDILEMCIWSGYQLLRYIYFRRSSHYAHQALTTQLPEVYSGISRDFFLYFWKLTEFQFDIIEDIADQGISCPAVGGISSLLRSCVYSAREYYDDIICSKLNSIPLQSDATVKRDISRMGKESFIAGMTMSAIEVVLLTRLKMECNNASP